MDFKKIELTWSMGKMKKTVFATGIGNAMEWFDFGVYAYTTAYIGANFFSPVQNPQIQQIFTFAKISNCLPITTNRWDSVWNHW